ncbi:MAG: hypothetical protein DDT26_01746 [Dehalococcoidia bacterium]|nr:hypothetical protein [Chloroflexota bacterium]
MIPAENAGSVQEIFRRYPVPVRGNQVCKVILEEFAKEFNEQAQAHIAAQNWAQATVQFRPLTVTSAYPTIAQNCPRIAVLNKGTSVKPSGMAWETSYRRVSVEDTGVDFWSFPSQLCTDDVEIALCCLNERMRDDVGVWMHQYLLDAVIHNLDLLTVELGVAQIQPTSLLDDFVEYQGSSNTPGFQFYLAQMNVRVQYEMSVIQDIDALKAIANWQYWYPDLIPAGIAGDRDLLTPIMPEYTPPTGGSPIINLIEPEQTP